VVVSVRPTVVVLLVAGGHVRYTATLSTYALSELVHRDLVSKYLKGGNNYRVLRMLWWIAIGIGASHAELASLYEHPLPITGGDVTAIKDTSIGTGHRFVGIVAQSLRAPARTAVDKEDISVTPVYRRFIARDRGTWVITTVAGAAPFRTVPGGCPPHADAFDAHVPISIPFDNSVLIQTIRVWRSVAHHA
jgi:hypothetical protein